MCINCHFKEKKVIPDTERTFTNLKIYKPKEDIYEEEDMDNFFAWYENQKDITRQNDLKNEEVKQPDFRET